jgi:hypothetical protein
MWGIPVLAAGLLLAASVVFTNRWEISAVASSNGTALYILDNWTGAVRVCTPSVGNGAPGNSTITWHCASITP